jgi:hypothetical protein
MFCDKCGRSFLPGELKYKIEIKLWADFDGHLPAGIELESSETIKELLRDMRQMDQRLLEEDVYKTVEYILCKTCKDHFAANPLNLPLWSNIPDGVPPFEG